MESIDDVELATRVAPDETPPPRRTADVLVDLLIEHGVDLVFGLPGGAIAPLHDALLDRPEVRVVTTRNESGAMFAAAAYARATGRLGVVLVTSGPGVINAMTGLASAHCDGLPVLLLAGEVPRALFGKKALQEGTADHLNVVGMATPICKLAIQIGQSDAAPAAFGRAIATALAARRGPVLVTLPVDVTSTAIRVPHIGFERRDHAPPPPATLDRIAEVLVGAQRGVLFAGSGCRWDDGPARLRALAEALQLPVMTTPKAKGVFPESHPLSLGVFGHGGHPSATEFLKGGVDVLLAVGAGMSDPATDGWSDLLRPSRHLVQIDADATQIGRNYPVTIGVVGSAGSTLAEVGRRLPDGRAPRAFGVRRHREVGPAIDHEAARIAPHRALWELQQVLPRDALYTCDIGEHLLWATHYLAIDDPQGFQIMTGLASMGSSIGAAMGAQLAHRGRRVAAICGDGCFAMALGDLSTAAQERLPILVVVLNDERYGMVEIGHEAVFGRRPPYPVGPMSVPDVARALGAGSAVVRRPGELLALDLRTAAHDRPMVIDVRIDPAERMPKNKRNEALSRAVGVKFMN